MIKHFNEPDDHKDISFHDLKEVLGISVSIISTEHFMSAGLSSPWSTAKFAISDQDKAEVWHYFNKAAWASLGFGAFVSWKLKSIWPIASSAGTVLYYKKLYSDALSKTPTQNPTPVLAQSYYIPLTDQYKLEVENTIKVNNNSDQNQIQSQIQSSELYGYIVQDFS